MRTTSSILFGAFILAVIVMIWYRPETRDPLTLPAEGEAIHTFTLPNGIDVYLVENHRTSAVNHTIWVTLGAADEPQGKTGVAHFLEHLMFRGTQSVPAGEYSKRIERLGGNLNAFTSNDYTGYYVTIAKEHLPMVMQLEADRFTHLAPDVEDAARELKVVLEERAQRIENRPAARWGEKLDKVLYGDHPYAHPIIGFPDELAALTLDDAMAFYHDYYHAGNMIVVLVGDLTKQEAYELTLGYYGTLPAKVPYARDWPVLALTQEDGRMLQSVMMQDPQVKQHEWVRWYRAPSMRDGGGEALMPLLLFEHMLGGSTTSWLYQQLVVEQRIASDIQAGYYGFSAGPGRFSVAVTPMDGVSFDEVSVAVDKSIGKFLAAGLNEADLKRAKTQFMAEAIYARDGLSSIAHYVGGIAVIDADMRFYTHWSPLVDRVSVDDVARVGSQLFGYGVYVEGGLSPVTSEESANE